MEEKVLRIAPEWVTWPTWLESDRGAQSFDPRKLNLSADCLAELNRWDARFQSVFRAEDPKESGFTSPEDIEEFEADGRRLAQRIANELGPNWRVDLAPYRSGGAWHSFYASAQ